ncbi:MAG: flagellar type III secretion system pore protein FliP [Planctomycetota bacterium]
MRTIALIMLGLIVTAVSAQGTLGPPIPGTTPAEIGAVPMRSPLSTPGDPSLNPMRLIGDAAALLPNNASNAQTFGGLMPGGAMGPGPPAGGGAEQGDRQGFAVVLNIMVLLTALTLVPSVMIMTTCFIRILVVLALLRQALGTQSIPPAQVVTSLALFLTIMVMAPTIDRLNNEAVIPWQRGELADYGELWDRAKQPLRDYMFDQVEATGNWSSVYMLLNYRGIDTSDPASLTRGDVPTEVLVPAYMLSELKVGFLMGFRVYLPFLVIDMVIASILISMSMMMLPPILISLPFKLLLFVLVDGWTLVVGSLLESFVPDTGETARLSTEQAMIVLLPLLFFIKPPPTAPPGLPALCARGRR